jgi:hypothetical protein
MPRYGLFLAATAFLFTIPGFNLAQQSCASLMG